MKITLTGQVGSGKSSIGRMLAKFLGYKFYSSGDFQRELAEKKGLTLMELQKEAKTNPDIDKETDYLLEQIGKNNDKIIVDSHLGFYFIPDSFKIYFECDKKIAANRIFNDTDNKHRKNEADNSTPEKTLKNSEERMKFHWDRWKKAYGIEPYDKTQYDFVIDTSHKSKDEVMQIILSKLSELGYYSSIHSS